LENPVICSVCKGACCKASAGHIFPNELEEAVSKSSLTKLIGSDIYSFDWWGDTPFDNRKEATRLYYLRYKHKGNLNLLDNSKDSPCILLTENGCSLSYDKRPDVCKALIPNESFHCTHQTDEFSKTNCAIAWMPYQKIITELLSENNELNKIFE